MCNYFGDGVPIIDPWMDKNEIQHYNRIGQARYGVGEMLVGTEEPPAGRDPPPADRMDVGVQQWPSGGACSSNMSDGGTGDYCKSDTAGSEDEESKSGRRPLVIAPPASVDLDNSADSPAGAFAFGMPLVLPA